MTEPSATYWSQLIAGVIAHHKEAPVEVAINLWETLAIRVVSIVGEGGFNSLFSRSVFLTQSAFPWLDAPPAVPPTGGRFEPLKKCLEEQAPTLANAANSLLMVNFISIIGSIIGSQITLNILRLAWGDEVMNSATKELKNE